MNSSGTKQALLGKSGAEFQAVSRDGVKKRSYACVSQRKTKYQHMGKRFFQKKRNCLRLR